MSDGRFIGTDEGEWGGELFWEPVRGERVRILPPSGRRYQDPIYSLIPIEGHLYVMSGSEHMHSSGSMLVMYDIAQNKREIEHITLLPDAPVETLKIVNPEWERYLELVVIGHRTISKVYPTLEIKAFEPWKGLGVTSAALVDSNTILVGLTGGLAVVDITDRNRYVTKIYVPQRYAL